MSGCSLQIGYLITTKTLQNAVMRRKKLLQLGDGTAVRDWNTRRNK